MGIRNILVATDFSTRSDRALRRAVLVGKKLGAAIRLLHVIDDDQPEALIRAEQDAATALLNQQARSLRNIDGVECSVLTVEGAPYAGINRTIELSDADVIIIGPHRRQALKDVFIGTTAERTIRGSAKPVLMANGVPAGFYRHVLIAVDFSDCSRDAVQTVMEFGLEKIAAVSVVHVFDPRGVSPMILSGMNENQIAEHENAEEGRASRELVAFLQAYDIQPRRRLLRKASSSVARAICKVAEEEAVDLIVMGTHGRTGIGKAFLGSVTQELSNMSNYDVLVVPPKRGD